MSTSAGRSAKTDIFDVECLDEIYLVHGDRPLSARIHRPVGQGAFPAVLDVHGGGWCVGTNRNNDSINKALARRGIVVASIDFRMPPEAPYPAAVADVNFGVRWLKANAERFGSRRELVGTIGSSSGGHLTILSDMKPDDPRYAAIKQPGVGEDASVPYAVVLWPVICPNGRYQYLVNARPTGSHAVFSEGIARHDAFWGDCATMIEGSPVEALANGQVLRLPKVLYIQNEQDDLHPRTDLERFIDLYRRVGGTVQLAGYTGPSYDFIRVEPDSAEGRRVLDVVAAFIRTEAAAARGMRS